MNVFDFLYHLCVDLSVLVCFEGPSYYYTRRVHVIRHFLGTDIRSHQVVVFLRVEVFVFYEVTFAAFKFLISKQLSGSQPRTVENQTLFELFQGFPGDFPLNKFHRLRPKLTHENSQEGLKI
jgi:hypothetical protein